MSDPKSSYGEPVEEPTPADGDVVGRANEGLAEAEAAASAPPAVHQDPVHHDPVHHDPVVSEGAADPADAHMAHSPASTDAAPADSAPAAEPDPWDSPEASSLSYDTPAAAPAATSSAYDDTTAAAPVHDSSAATTAYATDPDRDAPTVTASEPGSGYGAAGAAAGVGAGAAATTAFAPQPIFVQAPEAPRPRGNRAAAGAIGLLAALAFAVLYLGAWIGFRAIAGEVSGENIGTEALAMLGTWSLWVPTVVFFVAFWLLGAIINRGRWGQWVIFGLLVGAAAYAGHILGQLFQAPFWMLTAREGAALAEEQLLAPGAIAAFIIGRELTIWFGAWVAARGRRVTELNVEAQREYERTLEAGPQLVRA
ncbi:ABC transporter [Microbacterium aurantiacum]|uniref:ABC transporter n=1 Tax=Microbacterium aurantiacum TaxID=162393 RepID=UPI004036D7EF